MIKQNKVLLHCFLQIVQLLAFFRAIVPGEAVGVLRKYFSGLLIGIKGNF